MNEQNQKPEKEHRWDTELLKEGLYCDLDQYEMLKRCSDKKDTTEWNKWREKNSDKEIWLQGKDFSNWHLKGTYFNKAELVPNDSTKSLADVHLENTFFRQTNLIKAKFIWARLQNAKFADANLMDTDFEGAHITSANFYGTNLHNADFNTALIDNETSFWNIKISRKTNFLGVSLNSIRIHPKIKQLLEYNIRRMNWEEWYKEHKFQKWLVKPFWWISDYGISTIRIIFTFLILAVFFAIIYYACGLITYPGIVSNLFILEGTQGTETVSAWLVPFRAVYFSIVTMTTLGFGDMYANPNSFWGHFFLTIQVILGYVLLGALVTRFAVLFTAGGPAGKFADEKSS